MVRATKTRKRPICRRWFGEAGEGFREAVHLNRDMKNETVEVLRPGEGPSRQRKHKDKVHESAWWIQGKQEGFFSRITLNPGENGMSLDGEQDVPRYSGCCSESTGHLWEY